MANAHSINRAAALAKTDYEEHQAELRAWLLLLTFGLLFIPSFTLFSSSSLRFLVYGLPVCSFVFWLATSHGHRLHMNNRFIYALLLYACLPMVGAFMQSDFIDKTTWISAFRPMLYLLAFVPVMQFTSRSVRVLTIIFLLTTAALWLTGSGTTRGELDLGDSRGLLESGLAFPLGGIVLYFLLTKQKYWALLAFVLFFIAFKRIAFGALFLVMIMMALSYLIQRIWGYRRRSIANVFLVFSIGAAIFMNLYYYEIFRYIAETIGSDQTVSQLSKGRLEEFLILNQQYNNPTLRNFLLGYGVGDATRKLIEVTITYPLQVHNSFLLYFYEFGVLGFAVLLLAFWLVFSRSAFGVYLLIYNVIIMVTDNTFNHHYHQITYFILISAMQHYEVIRGGKA